MSAREGWITFAATLAAFLMLSAIFFLLLGKPPLEMGLSLVEFAFGDAYSLSETLAKASPILFCALAVAVPGRLGLISVGAEGQLYIGAITGTALVLGFPELPPLAMIPLMLAAAALGGAAWGLVPGLLRARLDINETIVTLILNYCAVLFASALVFGPWRDPANQGWPATAPFPPAAVPPAVDGKVHLGLLIGVLLALALHVFFTRGRAAVHIRILAGNRKVGRTFGLDFAFWVTALMATGGAIAGIGGIIEVAAIQGRLQPSISLGYGLTGFLVSWLARHRPLVILPIALLVGGLLAGSDALQLFAKVPAASATILEGLLFATALAVPGLIARWRRSDGN
ncbi:simple sugar transport system permease protein [Kaistia soli DSM 19436]|uniref:Simple sugar transport system permease protein n=1 Tax=Kaistia soli DSM 19436 TaxID=1122133 RepID=A0A1M5IBL2_9HYPH|nr:ABC transporter permease [Kaistia soli]SHG25627.1 simple sugar transport system permease protein [Kaistia soli DSM 19436]